MSNYLNIKNMMFFIMKMLYWVQPQSILVPILQSTQSVHKNNASLHPN